MSSSEESSDHESGKQSVNRSLFVRLLSENPIVLEKSKTPSVVAAKKKAWEVIYEEYSQASGKFITLSQLTKMLNNMKTKIKIKTDKNATGNKKISLKAWEKEFLLLLTHDDNPVFKKVPGSVSVIGCPPKATTSSGPADKGNGDNEALLPPTSEQPISAKHLTSIRKCNQILNKYETEETRDLSTTQLQRLVLLQQMELQKVQTEREKVQLEKEKILLENLKKSTNAIVEN